MQKKLFVLILILVVGHIFVFGQDKVVLWKHLKPGPYAVGFRLIQVYDYSRTIGPKYDFEGKPRGEIARPMQIAVWYPAKAMDKPAFMKYEDYIYTMMSELDFRDYTAAEKKYLLDGFKGVVARMGGDPEKSGEVHAQETMAVRDAAPMQERFPLVLYAPGFNDSAYIGAILCEFLAGHGYVVAASPSMGMFPERNDKGMGRDMLGIEAQARDMEFVIARMKELPYVSYKRTGIIGFDWGGLSNVLLAMRNHYIEAVVSLTGAVGNKEQMDKIKKIAYTGPNRMRAAFMQVLPREDKEKKEDLSLYERMKYADAYWVRFHHLIHPNFNDSYLLQYYQYFKEEALKARYGRVVDMARVVKDYAILCEYVSHFMDAYVKKDGKGLAFLTKSPEANGVPPGVMYLESKSGLPFPPTEAEFFALLQTGGLERMKEVFYSVKQKDPGAYIFSKETMNRLGARFLNAGQIMEAIEIFKMNVAAYPENWGVYNNLGAAYAKAGNRELALKNFEKALKYNYQADKKEEEAYKKLMKTIELLKKK